MRGSSSRGMPQSIVARFSSSFFWNCWRRPFSISLRGKVLRFEASPSFFQSYGVLVIVTNVRRRI